MPEGRSVAWEIRQGDALNRLRELDAESVQCCVTSPPYFGLRDYGTDGQIGLEATPEEFVARLVEVFREVRRVLRDDGTLWLNIGDSYAGSWGAQSRGDTTTGFNERWSGGRWSSNGKQADLHAAKPTLSATQIAAHPKGTRTGSVPQDASYKAKDLLMVPAQLALALRADGWWLRSDIIWAKPNPMPESVTDRPTSAHEHLFLLAKSTRYFYDADAIREASGEYEGLTWAERKDAGEGPRRGYSQNGMSGLAANPAGRNRRNVWEIATQPYPDAHFATFPPKLVEPCILAGSGPRSLVLDPFAGSGTTGVVALRHDRSFIGIELSPAYCELARRRICDDAPLLNVPAEVAA